MTGAIGVRVFEMPITPERVVMALKRRDATDRHRPAS